MLDTVGYDIVAFEVDDLEAERARLAGTVVFEASIETPFGWRVAAGLDPDGNIIALHERTTAPASESIDEMLWIDPETF